MGNRRREGRGSRGYKWEQGEIKTLCDTCGSWASQDECMIVVTCRKHPDVLSICVRCWSLVLVALVDSATAPHVGHNLLDRLN